MIHSQDHPNSVVAWAIDQVVPRRDPDPALNPCEVGNANCNLSTGIEATFVTVMAHQLMQRLQPRGCELGLHEVIYIPNLRAEARGGFDLSIGRSLERPRVRTMHKLLYGCAEFNHWCDENWNWSIRRGSGDWDHLRTLLANFAREYERRSFQPFLVLNVCYCLHEYRRMGRLIADVPVPEFDNPLRTVIINLGEIVDQLGANGWQEMLEAEEFELQVEKQAIAQELNEAPQKFLEKLSDRNMFTATAAGNGLEVSLEVLTFQQLVDDYVMPLIEA